MALVFFLIFSFSLFFPRFVFCVWRGWISKITSQRGRRKERNFIFFNCFPSACTTASEDPLRSFTKLQFKSGSEHKRIHIALHLDLCKWMRLRIFFLFCFFHARIKFTTFYWKGRLAVAKLQNLRNLRNQRKSCLTCSRSWSFPIHTHSHSSSVTHRSSQQRSSALFVFHTAALS